MKCNITTKSCVWCHVYLLMQSAKDDPPAEPEEPEEEPEEGL